MCQKLKGQIHSGLLLKYLHSPIQIFISVDGHRAGLTFLPTQHCSLGINLIQPRQSCLGFIQRALAIGQLCSPQSISALHLGAILTFTPLKNFLTFSFSSLLYYSTLKSIWLCNISRLIELPRNGGCKSPEGTGLLIPRWFWMTPD